MYFFCACMILSFVSVVMMKLHKPLLVIFFNYVHVYKEHRSPQPLEGHQ